MEVDLDVGLVVEVRGAVALDDDGRDAVVDHRAAAGDVLELAGLVRASVERLAAGRDALARLPGASARSGPRMWSRPPPAEAPLPRSRCRRARCRLRLVGRAGSRQLRARGRRAFAAARPSATTRSRLHARRASDGVHARRGRRLHDRRWLRSPDRAARRPSAARAAARPSPRSARTGRAARRSFAGQPVDEQRERRSREAPPIRPARRPARRSDYRASAACGCPVFARRG